MSPFFFMIISNLTQPLSTPPFIDEDQSGGASRWNSPRSARQLLFRSDRGVLGPGPAPIERDQRGKSDFKGQGDLERTMSKKLSTLSAHPTVASRDDVRLMLGAVDEATIIEILALRPTPADLEEADIWATGDGDVLARSGRSLAGVVADIVADEEEPTPDR
jgi:hypothetical protein